MLCRRPRPLHDDRAVFCSTRRNKRSLYPSWRQLYWFYRAIIETSLFILLFPLTSHMASGSWLIPVRPDAEHGAITILIQFWKEHLTLLIIEVFYVICRMTILGLDSWEFFVPLQILFAQSLCRALFFSCFAYVSFGDELVYVKTVETYRKI